MYALGQKDVSATQYVRRLRGDSQPILVEASDGFLYVVKFSNSPQGPNLAFNEAIGTELYHSIGLPVPPWRPIDVSDSFIDVNPACWIQTERGLRRPEAGRCYGSRFIGGERTRLFEILPGNGIKRVRNREDFWLAWLVDVCAEHSDNREAIFQELSGGELTAIFIDHGHMFGGADGRSTPKPRTSAYLDLRIYPDVLAERFLMTSRIILSNINAENVCNEIDHLPEEWKSESSISVTLGCLDRLLSTQFVKTVADTIVDSLHFKDQRDRSESQFRRASSTSI